MPNQVAAAEDDLDFEVEESGGTPEPAVVASADPDNPGKAEKANQAPSDNIIDDIVVEGDRERNPNGTFRARPQDDESGRDPGDETDTDEEAPPKEAKPRNNPTARVKQAVARQKDAERRADASEARTRDLEERLTRLERPRDSQPRQEQRPSDRERYLAMPGAPKQTDYTDYGEFIADQTLFLEEQRHRERSNHASAQRSSQDVQRTRTTLNTEFNTRIQEAVQGNPEFLNSISDEVMNIPTFDVLQRGERPTGWHVLGEEIRRSDIAPAVMEYFTDNPKILQRIATLPPREITRTMAILESRITAASTGPAVSRDMSHAHPPIRPERGATVSDDEGSEGESVEAHIARENARERKQRRAR